MKVEDYIGSNEFGLLIAEIGQNNHLHVDQIDKLVSVIESYARGGIKKEELLGEMKEYAEIDEETAKKLIEEINTNILLPLRAKMQVAEEKADASQIPDMIDQRMQGTIVTINKTEKANIPTSAPVTPPSTPTTPQTYAVDPYREQIK